MNGDPNPVNGDAPPGQGVLPPSEGPLPPVSANQFTIRVSVENAEIRRILREGIYHLKVADYFQSGESEEELRYRENVITIDSNEPTIDEDTGVPGEVEIHFELDMHEEREYSIGILDADGKYKEDSFEVIKKGQRYHVGLDGQTGVDDPPAGWVRDDEIGFRNMIVATPVILAGAIGAPLIDRKPVGKPFTLVPGVGGLKPEIVIDKHQVDIWWEVTRLAGELLYVRHQSFKATVPLRHDERGVHLYYWTDGTFHIEPEKFIVDPLPPPGDEPINPPVEPDPKIPDPVPPVDPTPPQDPEPPVDPPIDPPQDPADPEDPDEPKAKFFSKTVPGGRWGGGGGWRGRGGGFRAGQFGNPQQSLPHRPAGYARS